MLAWLILFAFLALISSGCGPHPAAEAQPNFVPTPIGKDFDPHSTGGIQGAVFWQGALPQPPDLVIRWPEFPTKRFPNPHAPRIDAASRAVKGAVVYLRNVPPEKSRPWPHSPARVELRGQQFQLYQGAQSAPVVFVPQGEKLVMHNQDACFHSVRARGASFASLPLQPKTANSLVLTRPGHVELSSGSSFCWARGHVFVAAHAYHAVTDAEGRFQFDQVPEGTHDLVCWLPNWEITGQDYHPELRIVERLRFGPPLQTVGQVQVQRGRAISVSLPMSSNNKMPNHQL